ncbi:MAG: acyltransferase [Flavobacteriales bacterium]|nr:acyltransferase [Flavobacteriales bacterium]
MKQNGRLHNLDYLRGLSATGIMIYHYSMWTNGHAAIDSFICRVGVYGVSVFYVLSGLTLYVVYQDRMIPSWHDLRDFFKKRVLRIFPLLWLATLATLCLPGAVLHVREVILNLTGLFGFVAWDEYVALGSWSIGNELVFYVFFPLFVLTTKKSRWLFWLLAALIIGLFVYFSFFKIDTDHQLRDQWKNYIHPLNQVYLFLGGYIIGWSTQKIRLNVWMSIALIGLGFVLFAFYPLLIQMPHIGTLDSTTVALNSMLPGDNVHLVSGWNRVVFSLCCFMVCLGFYKLTIELPGFLHRPLSFLGEASYSVYLLHPIMYTWIFWFSANYYIMSKGVLLIISMGVTFVLSYFVYHYFEKYFMKLGRKKIASGN